MAPGTPITYTSLNPLGATEHPTSTKYIGMVYRGDTGKYVGILPLDGHDGWHMTSSEVDDKEVFVAVHESMFQVNA